MQNNLIYSTPSAYQYPLLIKNLFNNPIVDYPEREIVYRDSHRFTYAQFRERVHQLANMLTELGVKQGDTVAVLDFDSHRYLECYFAVPMIGAVLHTVNIRLSPEQILYTIDHAEDDVILVHADFLPLIDQIKGRIDTVKHYVLLSDTGETAETKVPLKGEYETLLAKQPKTFDFPELDENTRATTFYTTGTTGMPKAVYFSHRQLVLHTLGVIASLSSLNTHGRFHQEDVYMPMTPMFHVHAWGFPYIATFTGVKQIYPGRYAPDMLLGLIKNEGVTFTHCVPMILHMLLSNPAIKEMDISKLKMVIGGSALPKSLCKAALDLGIDIYTGYGMSETCPVLSLANLTPEMLEWSDEDQLDLRTKTGRKIALVDIKLVDDDMNEQPWNGEATGELVVRSPWLTQGYFKDHGHSEVLWRGGYLHTGDVANIDERGYIKITDRAKDVIKTGGEWVSSLEIEDIINQHPSVSEVAVIGMPDERWGERPLALVVKKDEVSEKDLVAHAKQFVDKGVINRHAMVLKVKFVDAIDRTSVGKIDKRVLREKHL